MILHSFFSKKITLIFNSHVNNVLTLTLFNLFFSTVIRRNQWRILTLMYVHAHLS